MQTIHVHSQLRCLAPTHSRRALQALLDSQHWCARGVATAAWDGLILHTSAVHRRRATISRGQLKSAQVVPCSHSQSPGASGSSWQSAVVCSTTCSHAKSPPKEEQPALPPSAAHASSGHCSTSPETDPPHSRRQPRRVRTEPPHSPRPSEDGHTSAFHRRAIISRRRLTRPR